MRPRLLDLFCGAGGAATGYHRAGFDVVGVDINPQPHYPFEFVQADALEYLAPRLWEFDAIHASPPCQHYSIARHINPGSQQNHPALVSETRTLLKATGLPWIIENVVGSPLVNPAMLCGTMFGLKVFRHRLFETSFFWLAPNHPRHDGGTGASRGYSTGAEGYVCVAGNNYVRAAGARAMGIDWMRNRHEISQAIPPAYTEYIGRQLLEVLRRAA